MKAVDLFAGAGGFTLGGEAAGLDVQFAANHWDLAVRVHAANHPSTVHAQQDLRQFDFSTLDPFDVLLASPSCVGHSRAGRVARAKSAKAAATHDAYRSTAWAVVDCLEVCRPRLALIENVPEFFAWELFPCWLDALHRLGYSVTQQTLLASRFGVPQRRRRAVLVAVHEGPAIALSNPAAREPDLHDVFDPDASGWRNTADMPKTVSKCGHKTAREKIEIANERLDGALGWGMHVNTPSFWGRSLDAPVNTLTTQSIGQLWWVRDGQTRQWTIGEVCKVMSFPTDYDFLDASRGEIGKLLGNAVPPRMAAGAIRNALQQLDRRRLAA